LRVKGGIFRGCFAVRLKLLASEIAGHRRTRRELRIIAIRIAAGQDQAINQGVIDGLIGDDLQSQ